MMKLCSLLCVALAPLLVAQDRAAIERAMPDLLREAQTTVAKTDLLNQFFVNLASGKYDEAVVAFDAWQPTRTPIAVGQYYDPALRVELFMRAKVMEARGGGTLEQAFRKVFAERFAQFSDRAAHESGWALASPVAGLERDVQRQLERRGNALELIRAYTNLVAAENMAPYLDAALAADDANRFVIQMDAAIRTKTGATISAIVVRKKNVTGKQPATLFHHIYTDTAYNLREAKESALRGYVGVVSDPRGKRLSPDAPAPWEHDVEDTNAVIEWISKQPWSDGQVGMYGYSYMGFAQWAAAKNRHPALKTIVPAAASFPGNGLPMQNNVFLNANYAWPFHVMNNKFLDYPIFNDRARWNSMFQKWYESGRPYREIDQVEGPPNPLLRKQMLHPSYDAYWKAMQPYKEEFAKINIPVLTLTGYYDTANSAAVNYLVDHYTYNPRANHYLVIGPYSHGGVDDAVKNTVVNGYTIDPAAQINAVELTYQWFDYVMKGGPKPAMLKDRINYEAMGANEWRSAPSITAMSMKKKLYLSSTKAGERYTLTAAKPGAGSLEQTVDFADRKTSNNLSPQGAIETQIDFPTRLVFVSEPFEEAVSFDGMLSGELKATIDKRDFDFTIALYEQMPDGKYFNLSYYLGRASYADDMATRKLLKPGEARVLPFSRTPLMSRQMSKGSRLVLLVTVNKNAFSQVNYGTGKDVSDESIADAKEPLHVKWHTDSFVEVPLWVGGK